MSLIRLRVRQSSVAITLDDSHDYRINIRPVAAQLVDLVAEFFVAFTAAIHRVQTTDHAGEDCIAQRPGRGLAVGRRCGTGMNGGKQIGFLRPDRKRAVAAMRIAHDENLVGIHIAKQYELMNEIGDKRIDIVIIETIPSVVRRP